MKAVLITKGNQAKLASRYGKEDLEEFPVGYWMVTGFGDNGDFRYCGVLTESKFVAMFNRGKALLNGFFDITKKPS